MPTFELRCLAHGPFEAPARNASCPCGCSGAMVRQEIRTAPAYRRSAPGGGSRMSRIDGMLTETAKDFGFSDLKNDGKAGVSVAQAMAKRGQNAPRWDTSVPRGEEAKKPYQLPAGFTPGIGKMKLPKPRPLIQGRYKG